MSELNHPNIVNILYWNVGGDAGRILPFKGNGIDVNELKEDDYDFENQYS
ncbi:MAG: hypothetical protein ACM3X1_08350 [Ignavibacteriales bacterium]